MSNVNLTSDLIANPHQAQIIHQNGTLIFANTAAAHLFGFDTIIEFVKYAKTTALFASNNMAHIESRTRILNFRCFKGEKKRAHVFEKQINWHGEASSYLTLKPMPVQAHVGKQDQAEDHYVAEETYIADTISAAMDWTRPEGNALEVKNKNFDFAGVSIKVCDDLQEYADSKNVKLNIVIKPRAQKIFFGDSVKMARAASCMVRHAIDRSSKGRVEVTLRAGENGDHIIFDVSDSGARYTPWDANIVFDSIRPTSNPGSTPPPMTNLELPLARGIARFLGGEIALKINHPAGGLVRMRLPFHEVAQDHLSMRRNGQSHRKLDILVVEDNPTSQHVIKMILEALGHQTTLAANGKECLDILLQANFDVILMDLHMPIQDGYSATQQIRARERSGLQLYSQTIPILAITADRRAEARTRALACGVTGFLTKPVHVPQIMAALAPFIEEVTNPLVSKSSQKSTSQVA